MILLGDKLGDLPVRQWLRILFLRCSAQGIALGSDAFGHACKAGHCSDHGKERGNKLRSDLKCHSTCLTELASHAKLKTDASHQLQRLRTQTVVQCDWDAVRLTWTRLDHASP